MSKAREKLKLGLGLVTPDGSPVESRQEILESFLSGIVLQFLLLVSGIIAARALGEEGRGQQALILIVALTASQVALFGLPLALTYEAAKGQRLARSWLAHIAPVALAQTVLVLTVYVVVMFWIFSDRVPLAAAIITIPTLPAVLWQAYGLAVLQGHHQFRALHFFRLTPPAMYTFGLVGVHAIFEDNLFAVMAVWSLSNIVGAVSTQAYISYTGRQASEKLGALEVELPNRTGMARFGVTAFLGASSPLEVFRVDQLAVGAILTTADLALYTTALAFCNFPRFLTLALGLTAYARISALKAPGQRNRMVAKYAVVGTAVAIGVSAPLAIFAGPLINLTFGPEFAAATTVTQVLLGATVLLCSRRILSDCLRGAGLPGAGSVAEITSLIVLVPATLLFVPTEGLTGFAYAMVASYLSGLLAILIYWTRRREKLSTRISESQQH